MSLQLNFDFGTVVGRIKPMHGVGQPPVSGLPGSMLHYLKEASIPYSRLHDVGGKYGANRYVDICNLFRDFDADETLEESYDFAFTDILISELVKHDCPPIFRLGETIENHHFIKAYRILPPKDPAKWARICEHVIRHYNEGWAQGFHFGITYWEIWNEPDNGRDNSENQMWHGTPEQFYELYEVAAKHLKACFGDTIKVGGYASCGFRHIISNPELYKIDRPATDDECACSGRSKNFLDFFEGFFEHIKRTGAPIDFFSWHSYLTAEDTIACAAYLDRRLTELGYEGLETQLNEWNNCCLDFGENPLDVARDLLGTPMAAAKAAAMLIALQSTKTEIACYYDARVGATPYAGMFNPISFKPFALYYSFAAFGELYRLGNQTAVSATPIREGLYVLAAASGKKCACMLVNSTEEDEEVFTDLAPSMSAYAIDFEKNLELAIVNPKHFTLKAGTVLLFKN